MSYCSANIIGKLLSRGKNVRNAFLRIKFVHACSRHDKLGEICPVCFGKIAVTEAVPKNHFHFAAFRRRIQIWRGGTGAQQHVDKIFAGLRVSAHSG